MLQHQLAESQKQAQQYIQHLQGELQKAMMENSHLKEKNLYLENKIKSIITQKISDYRISPSKN